MKYTKLIALNINDFSSSISFEKNYGLDDVEMLNVDKQCYENDGCICIVLEMTSDLKV